MRSHGDSSTLTTSGHPSPHDVARWCAAQGWPVHPLAAGRKTPPANCDHCKQSAHAADGCPCPEAGRWCHGFHAATTERTRLDDWWASRPSFGVGVSCGPAGLIVLDVDAHSAEVPDRGRLLPGIPIHPKVNLDGLASGYDTLALLAAFRGRPNPVDDEKTLRVRTPSGGLHIWYRTDPEGPRYRSSTGSSPKVALAWQVDVRAVGGYIVAPTTRTKDGVYTPVGGARLPTPLPAWLAAELDRTGHALSEPPTAGSPPGRTPLPHPVPSPGAATRLLAPLLEEVHACASTPEGASFTEKLNRAAYTAGGLVGAGHLRPEEAVRSLTEAATAARPGRHSRNTKIISDALAAGSRRPLHLKGRP